MIKVKTFTSFNWASSQDEGALEKLDEEVNTFFQEKNISKAIFVSDTATSNNEGLIDGIIRVVMYEIPTAK